MLLSILQSVGQVPTEKTVQDKISVVPRLRNFYNPKIKVWKFEGTISICDSFHSIYTNEEFVYVSFPSTTHSTFL